MMSSTAEKDWKIWPKKEIVCIYPVLSLPDLTPAQSNRVCNALALLRCVASHPDTRMLLLDEMIPKCLCAMEMGSELSKTVATFIVQKILLDDVGLDYICAISKRFFEVAQALGVMVDALAEQPSSRLLKRIIRACNAQRICLPDMLRYNIFSSCSSCLREDPTTRS